ncbi:TPR-like protein [Rickenella mellea]|uniref:TPR-like protein n=1 Tax=Rickenella mellea TaxID=50990 RepID=A0A4Y7PQ64_9AGAM|nr:TPR-like protein [Rickenella mellea]
MSGDPHDTRSYDLREHIPDKFHLVDEDYGMRNRGENVKLVPKADIIDDHERKSAAWTPWTENFFAYSKLDPPCSAPLSSLQRIFVKDLKLGCDYRETVAVLRTVAPPRRLGEALQTVVEDEQGTCIYLRIYGPVVAAHIDRFLPEGSVVAVKAPWCLCNKKFGTAMVVHYLTDFFRLVQGEILYPTKWNLLVPSAALSASEWFKEEGNNAYKSQKYQIAVVRYTEALNFKPNEYLKIAIYSNRAQAHLASGAFEAAIADSTFVLSHEPQHEKALYRCAIGHYGMKNYATAIELLKSLIEAYPSNETAKNDLRRAMQRVQEQTTGAYDFADMLKVSRGPCPQMDVADYIGPVKQQADGFFATRDIPAGELLMCTKSF